MEGVATTNWDSFSDPKTFLSRALQNKYINADTPDQIWANLTRVCAELKIPRAAEQIEQYRRQHLRISSRQSAISGEPSSKKEVTYDHDEAYFNMVAPRIIAAKLYPIFRPKSVVDVGCGLGTFLRAFKESGAETVLGLDGEWVDRSLLSKYISLSEFKPLDLQSDFKIDARFDLVISLEVAEHLRPESADRFVRNLVTLGDVILFSAATPATWFDSTHLNNQWPDYWRDKFAANGYSMHDVVRHLFVDDQDVFNWYRTNMFLVTRGPHEELLSRLAPLSSGRMHSMQRNGLFYPRLNPTE